MEDWIEVDEITKEHEGYDVRLSDWPLSIREEVITAVGRDKFLAVDLDGNERSYTREESNWLVRPPRKKHEEKKDPPFFVCGKCNHVLGNDETVTSHRCKHEKDREIERLRAYLCVEHGYSSCPECVKEFRKEVASLREYYESARKRVVELLDDKIALKAERDEAMCAMDHEENCRKGLNCKEAIDVLRAAKAEGVEQGRKEILESEAVKGFERFTRGVLPIFDDGFICGEPDPALCTRHARITEAQRLLATFDKLKTEGRGGKKSEEKGGL